MWIYGFLAHCHRRYQPLRLACRCCVGSDLTRPCHGFWILWIWVESLSKNSFRRLTSGLCGIIFHAPSKARQLVLSLVEALGPQHPRSASARRHQLSLGKNLWDSESSSEFFNLLILDVLTCSRVDFSFLQCRIIIDFGPTHSFPLGSRLLHMQSHVQCIEED